MASDVHVLGLDPGFASFGYGIVKLLAEGEEVRTVDVIRTTKSAKKLNVKAVDDNFQRAKAIAAVLHDAVDRWKPIAIAAEAASWPRNAGAAVKVAMAWGIVADLCYIHQLPMVQATPQEIKKVLCNNKSATKEDVRRVLENRYPTQFTDFKIRFKPKAPPKPHGQWEHGYDAVGSVVACLSSDVLRMARGMVG